MIRIIDKTLIMLDVFQLDNQTVHEIAELLFACGVNYLEVTPSIYKQLQDIPGAQYILRIDSPIEAAAYGNHHNIKRFLCKGSFDHAYRVYPEIRINDMRDFFTVERYKRCDRVRVCGLADSVLQPMNQVFQNLRSAFDGTIEFAADNDCYSATSLTLQWVTVGGMEVVTSFMGMGNMAAFEDITRLLFFLKGRRSRSELTALKALEARITTLLLESDTA